MSIVQQPISVEPFLEEAREMVRQLLPKISLKAILLDDWRGVRLVYDAPCVRACQNYCENCPLFQLVGEDIPLQRAIFRASLYRPTTEQLALFHTQQKYLNCKTISQYQECYSLWILEKCLTNKKLLAELNWVRGFQLIYYAGVSEPICLARKQLVIKRGIINLVLKEMKKRGETARRKLVADFAREFIDG